MEKQFPVNRVVNEVHQWRAKEERLSQIFSFGMNNNRVLLREKLRHYDSIAAKHSRTNNPEERLALRLLKQERRQIEHRLYPRLFLKLLRRTAVLFRQQQTRKTALKASLGNEYELKALLVRSGFGQLSTKLEQQLKSGQPEFSLPMAYYVNEKEQMNYKLTFARGIDGRYQLESYQAILRQEGKPQDLRQYTANADQGKLLTADQSYNLLAGRAVQSRGIYSEEQQQGRWLQLDLNDRDAAGNLRLKEFQQGYGFNLKEALKQLPIKEMSAGEQQRLIDKLVNGEKQQVSFLQDGKEQLFFIEANPQHKGVNIYDEHNKKITLGAAVGNKTAESVKEAYKVNERQTGQRRKNGMHVV